MELIEYKGKSYPKLQSEGFAAQYAFPFAERFCKGVGYDVGFSKPEWKFPGAYGVDYLSECSKSGFMNGGPVTTTAINFGHNHYADYIFSSHCLEHLPDYVAALDYWSTKLKQSGILFLYLPNMDYQQYWQPENNRKHLHYINPMIMQSYFNNRVDMWKNIFVTQGYDLNGSFYAIGEKT